MLKSLVIPDSCLATVAKSGGSLNLDELIEFLKPWHGVAKHVKDILLYLQKNSPPSNANPHLDHLNLPSKVKQKAILQALCHFKKQKIMDNSLVAEKAQMVLLRDQWLITQGKATLESKI